MKDNQIKLLNKEIEDLLKRNNELIYEDDKMVEIRDYMDQESIFQENDEEKNQSLHRGSIG